MDGTVVGWTSILENGSWWVLRCSWNVAVILRERVEPLLLYKGFLLIIPVSKNAYSQSFPIYFDRFYIWRTNSFGAFQLYVVLVSAGWVGCSWWNSRSHFGSRSIREPKENVSDSCFPHPPPVFFQTPSLFTYMAGFGHVDLSVDPRTMVVP